MTDYRPDAQEALFLLERALGSEDRLGNLPPFSEIDQDLMQQVLTQAARFVGEVIAPLQTVGDRVGAQWRDGEVTMPPGFRQAYQAFWQAGWPALASAPEDGGQGLPSVLEAILYEWLSAANHGWTMAPGLLHGAYECIKHHASAPLKERYLEKLATGQWLATMCLTEPQAGSDLGLVNTRAQPLPDGRYALSGSKIFISGGDHDLSENIVHLVLARLPDSPPGPKGLSLFLVPKFYPDGRRSRVYCDRIEEKMGLHGSPTCAMRFDEAVADLVGEPGRGLSAMFVMMNAARLHVALQGIGLLDAAWQKADAYARERRQMRSPGSKRAAGQADPIAAHPAIGRILHSQKAWIDGGRLLAYRTAIELDRAKYHPDPQRRQWAQRWCSLITPVLKAAWTEQGFAGASACLQVFGGHGYVREWGIEQIVRDARVTLIYEGSNEVQAIDLLVRKVLSDQGQALGELLGQLLREQPDPVFRERCERLRHVAARLPEAGNAALPYAVADDYLRAMALLLLQWAWQTLATEGDLRSEQRREAARALRLHILPEFEMRMTAIELQLAEASTVDAPA